MKNLNANEYKVIRDDTVLLQETKSSGLTKPLSSNNLTRTDVELVAIVQLLTVYACVYGSVGGGRGILEKGGL